MLLLDYCVKALEQAKRKNKWALALLIEKEYSPDDFWFRLTVKR